MDGALAPTESVSTYFHSDTPISREPGLVAVFQEIRDYIAKKLEGWLRYFGKLKVYKKLISEFFDETVNNSHKFTKQNFLDRRGRHRVYAVVKTVNKELDELTNDVLNSEKDNIKILKRLDDIRGMILDIIM